MTEPYNHPRRTKRMQGTARRLLVVSAMSCARRRPRLIVRLKMCVLLLSPFLLVFASCGNGTKEISSSDEGKQRVVLRVPVKAPDQVYRTLWQRSFPEEYQELIQRAEKIRRGHDHPFAEPITIPDSELTPDLFSTGSEWGKGLPSKVFEQLGFPIFDVENGVLVDKGRRVTWNFETGGIEIYHSAQAIAAFRARFPEFEDEGNDTGAEQNGAGQSATLLESKCSP